MTAGAKERTANKQQETMDEERNAEMADTAWQPDVDHVDVWTRTTGITSFTTKQDGKEMGQDEGGAFHCPVRAAQREGLWRGARADEVLSWTTWKQWWDAIEAAEDAGNAGEHVLLAFCVTVKLKRLLDRTGSTDEAFAHSSE